MTRGKEIGRLHDALTYLDLMARRIIKVDYDDANKYVKLLRDYINQPHICTASGYECDTPEITLTREQFDELMDRLNQPPKSNKGLEKLFDDDTLPPVNEATGHDTE